MSSSRSLQRLLACAALALPVLGCSKSGKSDAAASASAAAHAAPSGVPAPVASGIPGNLAQTSQIVNPKGEPAYSGPAGGVRGIVTIKGDPPPTMTALLARIPDDCAPAREAYAPMFREGMMRSVADVLVAVTGYQGYVPELEPSVSIEAERCSFNTRTIALTFGQSIKLVSKDKDAYVPVLLGSKQLAQILAMPGGSGTEVFPERPGRFMLSDSIKVFMYADVFVLKYATHAVTGLDGRYEIGGVPAGEVSISAFLPAIGEVSEKKIKILPNQTIDVNLEIAFDAKKLAERDAGVPVPQGSPGAAPSGKAP